MDLRRIATVAVTAALFAVPAQAADEQVLERSADFGARLSVAADGTASLVTAFLPPDAWRVGRDFHLRRAAPGARFGRPSTLVRANRTDRPRCAGVASDGTGIVVLDRVHAPYGRVRVRAFDATGATGAPRLLSTGTRTARHAACAVADTGAAIVAWFQHVGGGRWQLEAAVRDPGAARFGPARVLSGGLDRRQTSVFVAVGDRGDALAGWHAGDGEVVRPRLSVRPSGGDFGPARELAAPMTGGLVVAAVGASGHAVVAYGNETRERPLRVRLAVFRLAPGDAELTGPQLLGDTQYRFLSATVACAVTPAGRALIAWGQSEGRLAIHEAAPTEPVRAVATLGSAIPETDFAVAADDDGRALIAWSQHDRPVAAVRPGPSAAFGEPVPLGARHGDVEPYEARLAPQGGALVLWGALDDGPDDDSDYAFRGSVVTRLP